MTSFIKAFIKNFGARVKKKIIIKFYTLNWFFIKEKNTFLKATTRKSSQNLINIVIMIIYIFLSAKFGIIITAFDKYLFIFYKLKKKMINYNFPNSSYMI